MHRVVFPHGVGEGEGVEDRYSIAYFAHPVGATVLEAVPSERVRRAAEEMKEKGGGEGGVVVDAMTADEHLMGRLKDTYGSLYKDEEQVGKS